MGSAFLTSAEYDLGHRTEAGTSVIQQALLGATSSDTVRPSLTSPLAETSMSSESRTP